MRGTSLKTMTIGIIRITADRGELFASGLLSPSSQQPIVHTHRCHGNPDALKKTRLVSYENY